MKNLLIVVFLSVIWDRDGVVGIATRCGLEGPGIECRWRQDFRTYPDRLRGPPSLLYSVYRIVPGGKVGRGMTFTTHPVLVSRLTKKSRALFSLRGLQGL